MMKDDTTTRVVEILKLLLTHHKIELGTLCLEFNVSLRTLQRDIKKICTHLPVIKAKGGYVLQEYELLTPSQDYIKEFAKMSGIDHLYPSQSLEFLTQMNECKVLAVTPEPKQVLRSEIFDDLCLVILSQEIISFDYKERQRLVKPYKIIHIQGVWYLLGVEQDKLKHFSLSKIKALKHTYQSFEFDPKILKLIQNQNTTWKNAKLHEALLYVKNDALEFFMRKDLPQALKLIGKDDKGAKFKMSYAFEDEVINLAKMWLPALKILEPKILQRKLINLLEDYVGECGE